MTTFSLPADTLFYGALAILFCIALVAMIMIERKYDL